MILADTHAWLWWVSERSLLSHDALNALSRDAVAVSAITFWEVATLARRKRIEVPAVSIDEWIAEALERSATTVLDVTRRIAAGAGSAAELHGDPADRIIVATARVHDLSLVTKDRKIIAASLVPTIW